MATFVLVHGAWLWASAWNRLADILIAGGHHVVTPWLTGLGEKHDLLSEEIDLNTHVADVSKRLDEDDLTNVVLVGHGYAGMIITGVAELQRQRLSQLGDGGWRLPPNERYYAVWGLSPGPERDLVRTNATDFSLRCLQTPLDLPNDNAAKLPRAFIRGTRRYAAQQLFETFAQTARAGGWPVHQVQAGHLMYIEKPADLAEVLSRIANELCDAPR
jgi:pimeloyl-ACP methyl ester carboxylesterase